MNSFRVGVAALLLTVATGTVAQSQQEPIPPGLTGAQRAEEKRRADVPPPLPPHRTISFVELDRDAAELSRLAQQIPAEVEALHKGVLNKDLESQLKQIEKLSKRLRQEVRP